MTTNRTVSILTGVYDEIVLYQMEYQRSIVRSPSWNTVGVGAEFTPVADTQASFSDRLTPQLKTERKHSPVSPEHDP